MIRRRSILVIAAAAALVVPASATASPDPTRVSIAPHANYVSPQQINLEVALSCTEGLFYSVSASVVQQQGLFAQAFGSGFASGRCSGQRDAVAVPVYTFMFPGWHLGEAIANATACAFVCDTTARQIRIDL